VDEKWQSDAAQRDAANAKNDISFNSNNALQFLVDHRVAYSRVFAVAPSASAAELKNPV